MRDFTLKCLMCIAAALVGALSAGCGYERYPVRLSPTSDDAGDQGRLTTYGLRVSPPWPDGGHLVLSVPECIHHDLGAGKIVCHDDLAFILPCPGCNKATLFAAPVGSKTVRCTVCNSELRVLPSYRSANRWQIAPNERTAVLDVESPSMSGVRVRIDLTVKGPRLDFTLRVENKSEGDLRNLTALFSCNYKKLTGFAQSQKGGENCFVLVEGELIGLSKLPSAKFNKHVGTVLVVLTEPDGDRKVILSWRPGQSVLAGAGPGSICVNPHLADVPAGETLEAHGLILFTRKPIDKILTELPACRQD